MTRSRPYNIYSVYSIPNYKPFDGTRHAELPPCSSECHRGSACALESPRNHRRVNLGMHWNTLDTQDGMTKQSSPLSRSGVVSDGECRASDWINQPVVAIGPSTLFCCGNRLCESRYNTRRLILPEPEIPPLKDLRQNSPTVDLSAIYGASAVQAKGDAGDVVAAVGHLSLRLHTGVPTQCPS